MSDPRAQRNMARQLEQARVIERPGGVSGFSTFFETGSFTPTWVGSGTAGTFTYTVNACLVEWTRIGNRLFYSGRIVITVITVAPTANLTIAGWPYAGVADANMAIAGGGPMIFWNLNVAAGYTDVSLQAANGASVLSVVRSGDNVGPATVQGGELNVGDCRFEGQYRVA
jgi:hypothetical protein